jgi:hypothetical protein
VIVRPAFDVVHRVASGQATQAEPKDAFASRPWGRSGAIRPAGQVTVRATRSTMKSLFGYRPPGAPRGWTLHRISAPAPSSVSSSSPVP